MTSLSHSPVTFSWNLASSTSASAFLRSSHSGAISVPLKSLGLAGFVISRRDFTVSVKVSRGEKRHVYPLIAERKKIMEIKKLVNETDLDLSGAMISLENKLQKESLGGAHSDPKGAILESMDELTKVDKIHFQKAIHEEFCEDSGDEEIIEEYGNGELEKEIEKLEKEFEAFKKKSERAEEEEAKKKKKEKKGIKQFDWSFVELCQSISEFIFQRKKDFEETKKKIEELDGAPLSPSLIKAMEAEKKEIEEFETMYKEMKEAWMEMTINKGIREMEGTREEVVKKERKRFKRFSAYLSDSEKNIEAMKKNVEELERRTEILDTRMKRVEEIGKKMEKWERGEENEAVEEN